MGRRSVSRLLALSALSLLFGIPGTVTAHEGDPRLILEPTTVAPGGGIRVTGEDLEPGSRIRLSVEGLEDGFAAAELVVDPAGHFTREVPLPPALKAGVYGVKAEMDGELVASDVLLVADGAGPGIPIDRPSPWLPIAAVGLGVGVLLGGLRLLSRRRTGAADGGPGTARD